MTWSPQQDKALRAVAAWAKDPGAPQVFRLFGYAGTGKTTMAKEIAHQLGGRIEFATFTGKAALVLRSKGCKGASTIHSLIYKVEDENGGQPRFVLNEDSTAASARLLIIDEVSMVDEEIGRDLLSFGTKVLVLGDPAQLPPVRGTGFFTSSDPDIMLTEVHRQARDNPIIRLSMDVREGRPLRPGHLGDSKIIQRAGLAQREVLEADQVLVGTNRTRRRFNDRIRSLLGRQHDQPEPGDRLVCLRNNREKQLLNGGLWTVLRAAAANDNNPYGVTAVEMEVQSDDEGGPEAKVKADVPMDFFHGTEADMDWRVRKAFDEFDYGYALTVHKSQGSQWDNVMLFDESTVFRKDARRWLYTGITRAAERVTVVLP